MDDGTLILEAVEGPDMACVTLARGESATIGRSRDCRVCLPDPTVSRHHASLVRRGDQWYLRDLESRHGTFLNAVRLAPSQAHPLVANDLLRIGPWTFRIVMGGGEASLPTRTDDDTATHRVSRVSAQEIAEQRLHLILDGVSRINSARNEQELAEAVVDSVLAGTVFDRAAFLRDAGRGERVHVMHSRAKDDIGDAVEFTFSRSLLRAASNGQVARLTSDGNVPRGMSIERLGITDALCAPVLLGGVVVAYLYLDARGKAIPIASDAAHFCLAVARMCGLALANLKRIELEERQRSLDRQLSAAREAQQVIMPPREGRLGEVSYAMHMRPGSIVAGDLFDIFALDDRRVAVVVGDVTGDGIGAALLMTGTQSHLHAALRRHCEPSAALDEVNQYVSPRISAGKFISMWVGVLDAAKRTIRYVDAGHGHWLIREAGGSIRRAPRPGGTVVGIAPELAYVPIDLRLEASDRLVLYSDGLVEQVSAAGDQFGRNRLAEVIAASADVEQDVASLFEEVERHAGTTELNDDATAASISFIE